MKRRHTRILIGFAVLIAVFGTHLNNHKAATISYLPITAQAATGTGWQEINGTWYYFNTDGAMLTGWQEINGIWYYFNPDGAMRTGWLEINGTWYRFDHRGHMLTGWQEINGTRYYFNPDGAMRTGWLEINGTWYWFDNRGHMLTGWQEINGTRYYFNPDGAMRTGWLEINGKWYWFDHRGHMLTGWQEINGTWYYFNPDGAMQDNGRVVNQRQFQYTHNRGIIDGEFYWKSSRAREWLHSTSTNPQFTNKGLVTRQTRGFLSGFTQAEIDQIAITRRKTPTNHNAGNTWVGLADGLTSAERIGSVPLTGNDGLIVMWTYSMRYQGDTYGDPMSTDSASNGGYDHWESTITYDKVFIPTAWELQRYVESRGWSLAIGNTTGGTDISPGYWVGGTQSYTYNFYRGIIVSESGRVNHGSMWATSARGIVPMLHLKPNAAAGQNKKIGDIITFGRYDSDNAEGHRGAIQWRIVNETPDGHKLIMAEQAVDHFNYNVAPSGDTNNAAYTKSNYVNFNTYDVDIVNDLLFQNTDASGTKTTRGNPLQPWFRVVNTSEFHRRNTSGARFQIQGRSPSGSSPDTLWVGGNFVRGANTIEYRSSVNDPDGYNTPITIKNNLNIYMIGHLPYNMIDAPVNLDVKYDLPYNGYASNNQYVDIDVGLSNWDVNHVIPHWKDRLSGIGDIPAFMPPNHTTYAGTRYRMSGRMRVTDWGGLHSALSASEWDTQGLHHRTFSSILFQPRYLHDMYLTSASFNTWATHGYDGSVGPVDPWLVISWAKLRDAPGDGWVNFSTVMPTPNTWLNYIGGMGFHAYPNVSTRNAQWPEIEIENWKFELIDDQKFKLQSLTLPNGQIINNPPVGSMARHRVTSTGNYSFTARDTRGYDWNAKANIKIDKTAPAGSITANTTGLTNGNVTLTLDSRDNETGLSKVEYISGGKIQSSNIPSINQSNYVQTHRSTFVVSENGTYRFRLTDRAGNVREVTHTVGNIDRTPPTTSVSQTPTAWTNQNVAVSWTANAQGLADLHRVRFHDGSGWSAWVNTSGRTQTFNRTITANTTVYFEVEDVAGNVASRSHTVNNIDKDLPEMTFSHNPSTWTNTNVTTTIRARDHGANGRISGLNRMRFRSHSGTWGSWISYPSNTELSYEWFNQTSTITENGGYDVQIEDRAGNVRLQSFTVDWIDRTPPTVTSSHFPTGWTNGTVTITWKGTTEGSPIRRSRLYNGSAWGAWITHNHNTVSVTRTQAVTANGTYRIQVEDQAGNIREATHTVGNIDKAVPNGTITGNPTSWTNQNVTLTFNATDTGGSGVRRVRIAGGSWVNGSTTTQTATTNGTYSFEVEDNAGNTRTVSVTVNRIDKALPNGTITGNPTSWTNQNVTLTFNATDTGGSGVRRVRIAGGSWVNGSTTTQTATTNGTYSFEVEDNAGNTRTVSATVNRIDKALPNGTISGNPTSWTNQNVTLTFNATDTGGSGVRRVRIAGGTWVNGSTTTQTATTNGTYRFEVEDNAGNTRTVSVTVNRIDKTLPNGTITGNPTSWTNQNVTLTFNATDTGGSGVRRVRIAGGSWVNGSTTTQTATTNGTYSFEVEDNAGNTRTVSVTVNRIDKALPNGTITGNPTSWTNQNVTLTFNATDTGGSGVRRVRIAGGSWVNGSTTTQTATTNGTYSFEVEDNAGNTRTVSVTVNRIDKALPNGTITGNPTSWTNQNVTLTFNATDTGGSGVRRVRIAGGTWVNGSTTTQTATTNGTYSFEVEDNAGNTRTVSVTVNLIDKTVPNMETSLLDTGWTNGSIRIRTRVSDRGDTGQTQHISGVNQIRTRIQGGTWSAWRAFASSSEKSSLNIDETWSVTSNGTYEWQLEDRAGNVRSVTQTVSNIDTGLPSGSATHMSGWTNGNVWIDVTGQDTSSGLASIKYVSGGAITGSNEFAFTGTTSSQTVRFTATQNGTYSFDITDRAGNVRRVTRTVDNIDRTVPQGAVTQTPTVWTNQNVTLQLTGGDLNSQGTRISGVDRVRMRPVGATSWTETRTISDSTEASPNFATQSFTVASNGRYQFELRDRAGNIRMVEHTVGNIDKAVPNMAATSLDTNWTNGSVRIRTRVSDKGDTGDAQHISGVNRIRMRTQGGTWGAWRTFATTTQRTSNNFDETWTISVNGTYEWQLEDRAGNIRTAAQTVSNIDTGVPSGSATHMSDWTNGNVWIDVAGQDTSSGLASIRYVSGGTITGSKEFTFTGTTSSQTVRFTATQNGTYSFDVVDRAGNVRRVTRTVDNIDRTAPTATTRLSPNSWTNQNVNILIKGNDLNNQGTRISGVDRVRMRLAGSSTWLDTQAVTDSTESSPTFAERTFTVTENGVYEFEVRDRAGNTSIVRQTVDKIDRNPPKASGSFTPDGWTNQDITITWIGERTGNPSSPLRRYRTHNGTAWSAWQNASNPDRISVNQVVSGNGTYRFEVQDEAGNIAASHVVVSQYDNVAPTGNIRARFDRTEQEMYDGSLTNANMVDQRRVTVDVFDVEDLGISGVEFVEVEEQRRTGSITSATGSTIDNWQTVNTYRYDWPDPYTVRNQTYHIDAAHALDTRFVLTVQDRAGNRSTRATSNPVRQSVLQFKAFKVVDVVNPSLSQSELDDLRNIDFSAGTAPLTAGTNVTVELTYQLRHLDTVERITGTIKVITLDPSDAPIHTTEMQIDDEPITGHNRDRVVQRTFTVPEGVPRGSTIRIEGNLVVELENGSSHEITYPDNDRIGSVDNHLEEFFRFRIVR